MAGFPTDTGVIKFARQLLEDDTALLALIGDSMYLPYAEFLIAEGLKLVHATMQPEVVTYGSLCSGGIDLWQEGEKPRPGEALPMKAAGMQRFGVMMLPTQLR